jgi:phage terminase large subunit-like protein
MANETYSTTAHRYAEAVVAGDILTCNWVQKACKRQLNDLAKFKGKASPYHINVRIGSTWAKSAVNQPLN